MRQTRTIRSRPTTARSQPFGIFGSILFHGLIVAAALFTFQRNLSTPEDSHVVPVDLVTVADKTNVAAQAPPTPPAPEKMDMPTPPAPEPLQPQMQDVEPAPEPPVPKFDVEKEKKPPVDKPVEKPQTKKEAQQDFNDLLNKLTALDRTAKNVKAGPRVIQGIGAGNMMTADLADALKSQIYRCWSPPTGAPDIRDLVVDYDLRLNPDGTVGGLQLLTLGGNSYTRAAAEAASRAIYQCQPYRLPPDRYNLWREINPLRFDPRQMMQ